MKRRLAENNAANVRRATASAALFNYQTVVVTIHNSSGEVLMHTVKVAATEQSEERLAAEVVKTLEQNFDTDTGGPHG
jgi:hypothetical protein